jgi:lysophospholipase L1-like esterase
MKKKLIKLIIALLVIFLSGEIVGRYYGLHDYPVYVASDEFEYVYAPNQNRKIYRNRLITNQYGMRSKPLSEKDTSTILLIGDSVVNGGNLTDHDSLGTSLLENLLTGHFNRSIRVLNISAGSWGPDNGMAYVKEYGLFDADAIVLVVSSHDAHDNMSHEEIVGKHPQFLSKNYGLAWGKLIERGWQQLENRIFASKKQNKINNSNLGISDAKEFNEGYDYFRQTCVNRAIPLLVYLHPTIEELDKNEINKDGLKIIEFCKLNKIELINELESNIQNEDFRDGIHYSQRGQKHLSEVLFPRLINILD